MLDLVIAQEDAQGAESAIRMTLDELAREGARRMIAEALLVEVDEFVSKHRDRRDGDGLRLVVRNGFGQSRSVTVGSGTMEIRAPRVRDQRPEAADKKSPERFSSSILPRYARRSPGVEDVLPVLYLRGLSSGDFRPALQSLLGDKAQGLSPSAITRLKAAWQVDYRKFRNRSLADHQYAYIWVDGVHFNIRLEDDRLCALVVLGVREDGTKELLAIEDGYRESSESWATVLRDLKRRGMNEPNLAVGDGALGFWKAVRDVFPNTREQRCWVHKIANVLDKLPKRLQGRAKERLHEIMRAESREAAEEEMARFEQEFQAKYPKATTTLMKDREALLAFFDFPAEHWHHLRTTNAIESIFATVKLRTRVTKGAGSRTAALLMAYKLMEAASARWRAIRGKELVVDVLQGKKYSDGVAVEECDEAGENAAA